MPLTPAWTPLRHHPQQADMWTCGARFIAAACGRGSGKTELSRRRVVRWLPVPKPHSDPMYFFAMPTYKQAKRVAWNKILRLIPQGWLRRQPNVSDMEIRTIFGSWLFVVGLDKPQRIEGDQWDGGVIDESSDVRPKAFDLSILPALSHRHGWCWRVGVPKRFGIGALEYKAYWDAANAGELPDARAFCWPSRDIIPPEELEIARKTLDSRDFAEQYEASWEQVAGRIYHAFDDAVHVTTDPTYSERLPLIIGSDFNVDPMCWVVCQEHDSRLFVLDEIFKRDTTTQKTLDELHSRFGQHPSGWLFHGDASGRSRNTRASFSDYAQIKNDRRFRRARVLYPKANPLRFERFAATNAMLRNASGDVRLLIHPRCTRLIADLRDRQYAPGTREPADTGDVGHMADAMDYVIHKRYPIVTYTRDPSQIPKVSA